MMTPSEVFRWPVEFVKRHWASILAIIAVIFFVSVFKNADFSKSDFGSIGGISMDQISAEQWIMLVIALIVGIFLLYLLGRALGWWLFAIIILFVLLFQPARDRALDFFRRPEVSTAFTGTETTRSVQATSLEPFKVCELEPNASYTFVKVTTSEQMKDEEGKETISVYRTKSNKDDSVETHKVTGGFFDTPEELPYHDANYAGGILLNNVPPGRIVKTDEKGCMDIAFNTSLGKYRSLIGNPWIGIYLRK